MYSILSCASGSEVRSVLRTTSIISETRDREDYIMIHNGHNTYQDLLQMQDLYLVCDTYDLQH